MKLPIPNGYITATYQDHVNRGQQGSFGVDISTKTVSPVIYFPYSGMVVSCGYSQTFGNRIWVRVSKDLYYVLAHMDSIAEDVEDGINIKEGWIAGVMGNTGMSRGAHLHFEFRTSPNRYGKSIYPAELESAYKQLNNPA